MKYKLKTIKDTILYKKVNSGRMNLKAKNKTQISIKSKIPVCNIQLAEELIEHDLLLEPSTSYSINFYCDKEGELEISLGGSNPVQYTTVIGFNQLTVETSVYLANKNFIVKGRDIKISKVKIIKTNETITDYFEGLLSVHDYKSKDIPYVVKVRTHNEDSLKEDVVDVIIQEPLRSINELRDRIIKVDNEWVVERNCVEINLKNNIWYNINYDEGHDLFITRLDYIPPFEPSVFYDFMCDKYSTFILNFGINFCYIFELEGFYYFAAFVDASVSMSSFDKNVTLVLPLKEKRYEKLSNKLEAYTYDGVTHVENNSTIPCKMNIKNHGFDIRNLSPDQTYTAIHNSDKPFTISVNGSEFALDEGMNKTLITAPEQLIDNDILFYGKGAKLSDFSLLEGTKTEIPKDYVKKMESAYESEYIDTVTDINYNKYKATIKTNQRSKTFYLDEPLRIGDSILTDNKEGNCTILKKVTGQVAIDKDVPVISIWSSYNKNHVDYIGFCLEGYAFENATASRCLLLNEYFPSHNLTSPDQINGEHIVKVFDKIYLSIKASRLKSRDEEGLRDWLSVNPFVIIYQLDEPVYTTLDKEKLTLQAKENTVLSTDSNVPVESISFNSMFEFDLKLKESTRYRVSFISTANAMLDTFYCAGVELRNIDIKLGNNTFLIDTPEFIDNNIMVFNGEGFSIFNVMITEGEKLFESYFEDTCYLGELTEDNQYLIKVQDKEYLFDTPLRSTRDKKVFDILRYDYNSDKVIIERNVNDDLVMIPTTIEETDLTHDDMCLTTNEGMTQISFISNLPITAHVSNRGYRIKTLSGIEPHTIVIDGEGHIRAKLNGATAYSDDNGIINMVAPINMPEQKLYLLGAGAHTDSIMILKGRDVKTNGYFEGMLSCFENEKVTEPTDNNYGKYRAKFIVEGPEYYYIKTLYLNSPLYSGDYLERKRDGIYHIKSGKATKISSDDFVLDIFKDSKLMVQTLIPLSNLTTTNYEEPIDNIKTNTKYIIKFVSDRSGVLHYIDLGGKKLEDIAVQTGLNTVILTTQDYLLHDSLIFDGLGMHIKEVLVTEYKDDVVVEDIYYFEGTKSSYETEYNDFTGRYKASLSLTSKNLFNGLYSTMGLGGVTYYYTEYIPIDGYKKYVSNIVEDGEYKGQIFLYDKNKNQLYTEMMDTLVKTNYKNYPINKNIRYLQMRFLSKYDGLQIEEGITPTEFVEHHNSTIELSLLSPFKDGDEILYKSDGNMHHYLKDKNKYEKVHTGHIQLKSAPNVQFKTISPVPIKRTSTIRYKEEGLNIQPNTSYLLKFDSDKDGMINFLTLGGVTLNNMFVTAGTNTRIIDMPESTNDKLIIDGQGVTLSRMIITPHVSREFSDDIEYFEGTKSSYESDKTVVIKSISGDQQQEDTISFKLSTALKAGEIIEFRPYGVFHVHDNGYEEELEVEDSVLKIFERCTIQTISEIPVKKITSKIYEQRITKLKPLTTYIFKFNASNAAMLDITLGGTNKQCLVLKGTNSIEIQTPVVVSDDTLKLSAKNLILENVLLMEKPIIDIGNINYFDTVQSVFESEKLDDKYIMNINISNKFGHNEDYTVQLSSPLLEKDSIVWDGKDLRHYHNTVIDTDSYTTTVSDQPYYEVLNAPAPIFNIPAESIIKINSNIPIKEFTTVDGHEELNLGIEANKEYFVIFDSDKDAVLDKITLGSSSLRGVRIYEGRNCITIRTYDEIDSYSFKVNGTKAKLTNILIIENTGGQLKQSVPYFKGIRHTFDNEQTDTGYKAEIIVVSYDKNDTYHIDKKELTLSTPLIENDRITVINESLYHIHNSKLTTLSGYELWRKEGLSNSRYVVFSFRIPDMKGDLLIADRFFVEDISADVNRECMWFKDSRLYISIAAENIEMNNITMYLEKEPITIVYDLIEPVYELLDDSELSLYMEEKANLYIETFIPCKSLSFSYDTGLINLSELSQASYIISNTSLDILAQTWEADYKLSEIEWALQNQNILLTSLRSSSMLVISRYVQAKRLIENEVYDRERMTKQLDRYYEKKELTREEYEELTEMIN
jgi:hypothetical protein